MLNKEKNNLQDLKIISKWLDSKFTGPFGIRFGFDSIIGLIPGIGDLFTTFIGSYIVVRAGAMNVPKIILARMGLNLLIDQLIGSIPLLGDIFDVAWKSNEMNYKLVLKYSEDKRRTVRAAWLNIAVAVSVAITLLVLPIYLFIIILQAIF